MSVTCPCLCNVHVNLDFLERFRESEARNTVAAVLSGILFFSGWWIIIDAAAAYPMPEQFEKAYHTIGVVSTVAFFMMNSVTNQQVRGEMYDSGCFGSTGARIWIFTAFVMAFSALIAAMWIFFGVYIVPNKDPQYPGLAIFLQNVLIFLSGIVFKFGRLEESY